MPRWRARAVVRGTGAGVIGGACVIGDTVEPEEADDTEEKGPRASGTSAVRARQSPRVQVSDGRNWCVPAA